MRLETISTGDELVRGRSEDTNAPWIAARAAAHGVLRVRHTTVGDEPDELAEAFRRAADHAEVVVVTGGLGPTEDDHTREAAARAAGVDLVEDPDLLREIREGFERRGIPMHERNRVQALLPAGAEVIRNPLGSAPGFHLPLGRSRLFFLSGVPREMKRMFEASVAGYLESHGPGGAYRSVASFGKPEAHVDERLEDLSARDDLSVGITAVSGVIRVTLQAVGEGAADRVAAAERIVRERLGPLVLEGGTLAESVGLLLGAAGRTLATAESCTGGLVSKLLTDVPGISACYRGGLVAYSNDLKERLLGVPPEVLHRHGAVSEATARAMAEGGRKRLGADLAVAVTGIAGPTGGSPEKPVGLVWFALAAPERTIALSRNLPPDRDAVRRFAANIALNLVRRHLQATANP